MGLGYAFREAILGLYRARGMSLVSIGTTAVSLLVFGIFLLVTLNLYGIVGQVRRRIEIEVYLSDDIDDKEALDLKRKVEAINGVKEVDYIDKEKAADEFRQAFGEGLLEAVSQNPLPASLRIKVEDTFSTSDKIKEIVKQIEKHRGIEEIEYGRQWVERLDRLTLIVTVADLVIGLVIGLSSIFVVANTVNLTILARRESIEIMKLVGATDNFIQIPFLLEGIIGGTLGGALASAILYFSYNWAVVHFPRITFAPSNLAVALMIPLGAILGGLGSRISVKRVLKSLA